ncbi:MAG TPA: RNA-guided endonuclease TnpB family protein [Candidatus Nitrosotenuis sp.]
MAFRQNTIQQSLQRTFKFRLYPNQVQIEKLHHTLGACRWTYNKMIEKIHSEGFQSRNDLCYFLTELKESEKWLYSHHSKMLQMVAVQIDGAQKALIRLRKNGHHAGDLRFARFSEYRTFTYNQSGFDIRDGFLHLSKISKIKIIQHQNIPENNVIKQVTISRSKTGKWHACVIVDVDAILPKISLQKSIGIDVGIKNFAYDSDGFVTPNPLNYSKMLQPLVRAQRKISRRQKGSKNHKKATRFYQIIHERIKNKRKDFLHKLSTQYAKKYDVVFLERLQKLNMVKNHKMARNVLDSGWGIFGNMLDYKTIMIGVHARNTTIDCSRCGNMIPKSLAVRIHRCRVCGFVLDRDYNAAINILKKGLDIFGITHQLPQELREVTPVEIISRSRKQETTSFVEW